MSPTVTGTASLGSFFDPYFTKLTQKIEKHDIKMAGKNADK